MKIGLYEDWMKPQVIKLFSNQYGTDEKVVEKVHAGFYDNDFQKKRSVRLVAVDGDKVVGFQSLFYWPYENNGKVYHSLQSGNSLVHPDYRGKGIFQKLLNYIDENNHDLKIDFLMGFPVEASYGSFLRNKWLNPIDLVWYVRLLNPLAFLFSASGVKKKFDASPIPIDQCIPNDCYRLYRSEEFYQWLQGFRNMDQYSYFNFSENENKISFSLKYNKRNRWFTELVIGDIVSNNDDEQFIQKAFSKLSRKAFSCLGITALTVAVNEHSPSIKNKVIKKRFLKTSKKIHFITKPYIIRNVEDPGKWELYRSDIDTW